MKEKIKENKPRLWDAVVAHFRNSKGPMKSKRYEEEDWENDWEQEQKELENERTENEGF